MPNSDSLNVASAAEREELSCIFLEVTFFFQNPFLLNGEIPLFTNSI